MTITQDQTTFEDASTTPVIDSRKFFLADVAEFRDSGIKPLHVSSYYGARKSRSEFLSGAELLGFNTEDRPLLQQQFQIADAINAQDDSGIATHKITFSTWVNRA